ncbi:MAG: hypothetical protein ACJAYU_000934 [Bradymonadia bacterium]|jgi:hypothetical protein
MRSSLLVLIAAALTSCSSDEASVGDGPMDDGRDAATGADTGTDTDTDTDTGTDADIGAATDASPDEDPERAASVNDVILEAGQTESETERFALLESLLEHPALDDALRGERDSLLPIIDQWANGRERYWVPGDQPTSGEGGYLALPFNLRVLPDLGGQTFPPRVRSESPLYAIWALYRGRMLIWSGIQTGGFVSDDDGQELWFGGGRSLLAEAAQAFPDNRIIGMYLDEPIPWDSSPVDANAPEWAALQREALNKFVDIVEFWIDERQAPDGQFGGGWGDDVEMWRWWTPVLVAFEDPEIIAAQALLSEGIFALPRLEDGYSSILTDVEHSAEDSSDAITAMLLARPGDATWEARADRIADLARESWMARNERGFLQFQSAYFTPSIVSANERYACDTARHARALQPLFHLWRESGDEDLGNLLTDWLDTWVDAAASEERGKPSGVLPSAIHWPSGEVGGPRPDWWDPGCAENPSAFAFPGSLAPMTEVLVLAWQLTGDESYLAPIHSMSEMYRAHLAGSVGDTSEGSNAWTASKLSRITDALARYRSSSGDQTYDDLIVQRANGYVNFRLTDDTEELLANLARMVETLRYNEAAYTTEVRYTDRIRKFSPNYANLYADVPLASLKPDLLYSMLSGDLGSPLYFSQQAVRWVTSPRDFTAWVVESSSSSFAAELYVFGTEGRQAEAVFCSLEPGNYSWTLECDGVEVEREAFVVGVGAGLAADRAELLLPSGVECRLTVESDV